MRGDRRSSEMGDDRESITLRKLKERFGEAILETHSHRGDDTAIVVPDEIVTISRFLKGDPELDYNMLIDITAVDYLPRQPRFEIVNHYLSLRHLHRVRLKLLVHGDEPEALSLTPLWGCADWLEREVWDMFGIRFKEHPNLKRILMYDGFEGHPLRKDYPIRKRQPYDRARELMSTLDVDTEEGRRTESTFLNLGPTHPAMHGIIRMVLEIEGESVLRAEVEIGYLHRVFEKHCETGSWTQAFPYTDRLNYVSPFINNFGYAATVEKLIGIKIPERAEYIRVLLSEISRITDHLTSIGAAAMELGAMTAFLYCMKAREWLYQLVEEVSGARITVSYGRIGGVKADLPVGFDKRCREVFPKLRRTVAEVHKLLTRNRIFVDRMSDIGVISKEEAISHGFTGPLLRACGVEYDVRKAFPYHVYDRMEFDIPVGHKGDVYDRYLVRMEEIEQSIRISEQCLDQMPGGFESRDLEAVHISPAEVMELTQKGDFIPDYENMVVDLPPTLKGMERQRHHGIIVDDPTVALPPKEEVYANIEALMNHFKIIMTGPGHGIQVPRGEAYMPVEGGNGELGFYIVSEGGSGPHRVRCRGPCFFLMSALHKMVEGHTVADIVPIFGSINMIGGELDR